MRLFAASAAEAAPEPLDDKPRSLISQIAEDSARTSLAHRWQDFRKACLQLAIESGAAPDDAVTVAGKFHDYILGPSERETKSIEQAAEDSE